MKIDFILYLGVCKDVGGEFGRSASDEVYSDVVDECGGWVEL